MFTKIASSIIPQMRMKDWYKEKLGYWIIEKFLNTLSSLDAASCSPARKTPKIQHRAFTQFTKQAPKFALDQNST